MRDAIVDLELVEEARHLAVDRVARMMAAALDDAASVRYFAGLLWRALRSGRLYALAQQLERLMAEVEEGGVRKPGAPARVADGETGGVGLVLEGLFPEGAVGARGSLGST